jgi:hypothetical protein
MTARQWFFAIMKWLVLVMFVAILWTLFFPGMNGPSNSLEAQARTDVNAIVNAVTAYRNEYGKLPLSDDAQSTHDGGELSSFGGLFGGNAAALLPLLGGTGTTGGPPVSSLNPRNITFLQLPTRKGAIDSQYNILDPWGTPYLILFDSAYSNSIAYPCGTHGVIPGIVVVASYGPHKICQDPALESSDNIYSFK